MFLGILLMTAPGAFGSGMGPENAWTFMPEFAQIVKSARKSCSQDAAALQGDNPQKAMASGAGETRLAHGQPMYHQPRTCNYYRGSTQSCLIEFNGMERSLCQVCREDKSCFMAFDGRERNFCQAYHEGKSCFMAMDNERDRGWCEVLREGKSCFMALNGRDREECEAGYSSRDHEFWMMFFR